jgi:aromatic ring-opening dioxygenase catalytic subunit (LigB family)
MNIETPLSPVLYIPHGGGPLPLLGDESHRHLTDFLQTLAPTLGQPAAIIVISAHWEAGKATITGHPNPGLIYDYSGFPPAAYSIQYPAPGSVELANKALRLMQQHGIDAQLDKQRGFDHGLFVPLKLMYPAAKIPCLQISLLNSLNPAAHIKIGQALSALRQENVLFIGSGFSFHNMRAFFSQNPEADNLKNAAFEDSLIDTCTNATMTEEERKNRLIAWTEMPHARFCHPREEHLLPLHVCYGVANSAARLVFSDTVLSKRTCAFLW